MDEETRKIILDSVNQTVDQLGIEFPADVLDNLCLGIAGRLESSGIATDAPDDVVTASWAGGMPKRVKVTGTLQRPNTASTDRLPTVVECITLDENRILWIRVDQIHEQGKLCRILENLTAQ